MPPAPCGRAARGANTPDEISAVARLVAATPKASAPVRRGAADEHQATKAIVRSTPMRVAILDDYQGVALQLADWSRVRHSAEITVFNDHIADPSAVVERLRPFGVICV